MCHCTSPLPSLPSVDPLLLEPTCGFSLRGPTVNPPGSCHAREAWIPIMTVAMSLLFYLSFHNELGEGMFRVIRL